MKKPSAFEKMPAHQMGKLKEFLLVVFAGFLLTTILTWPFLSNIRGYYPVTGDYPTEGWKLWYNFFSIQSGRIFNQENYYNSNQFYFYPYSFAYSDNVFVPGIIFSVIYILTKSLILSVNSYIFLTFILSFISSFYVFRYFVKNNYACAVGAAIFTFNPLTFAHFPGHIQLLNKFFLPPLFLFGYKFFTKPTSRDALLFFLFFTLNSLSSAYFFTFSLIFIPLMVVPITLYKLVGEGGYLIRLIKYLFLGILFLPILLYFNLPYLEFSEKEMAARSLYVNKYFSATLLDWLTPNPKNILYKDLFEFQNNLRVNQFITYTERVLFLNITPVFLFILGLWLLFKRLKALFFLFVFLMLSTSLLMLGPVLSISDKPEKSIILPYLYLYQNLPFLQGIRVPSRFQFIFYVIFALTASFGTFSLLYKLKKSKLTVLLLSILLIELITVENQNSYTGYLDQKSDAYTQFEQVSGKISFLKNKVTLHLPTYLSRDLEPDDKSAIYLAWLPFTSENMLNGFSGYFPKSWIELMSKFQDKLDLENIKILKALGVQYIIIHKDLIDKKFSINLAQVEELTAFEDQNVKILDLDKISSATSLCEFNRDFNVGELTQKTDGILIGLALQNKNDCYLVKKYKDRYFEFNLIKDGLRRRVYLKFPLVIEPGEIVFLVESSNDLKFKADE